MPAVFLCAINRLRSKGNAENKEPLLPSKELFVLASSESQQLSLWKRSMFSSLGTLFFAPLLLEGMTDTSGWRGAGHWDPLFLAVTVPGQSLQPPKFISIAYMCLCEPGRESSLLQICKNGIKESVFWKHIYLHLGRFQMWINIHYLL
ncbi:hypothetical protein CDAR_407671 [Caerostris darwini]|uniref:Uncharacterized protein n=1 Tax=Caerostris darwini TaxID=1538125 RepID=A0AAV4Q1U5_9ARAC|nr:hypothetical protein CDAR_407671 [Caerostris darwini]